MPTAAIPHVSSIIPVTDWGQSAMNDNHAIRSRGVLNTVNGALKVFHDLRNTMPVGTVIMFLTVALNEGRSQDELCDISGIKRSTASRYLLDLSDKSRAGDGYGLVRREVDPQELRRNMYSLTPKGRSLINELVQGTKGGLRDADLS